MIKFLLTTAAALMFCINCVGASFAADMSSRSAQTLSTEVAALAEQMAFYRGVVVACRESDGTALNPDFFAPRLAIIPQNQKSLFASTVKRLSSRIALKMSGPKNALYCDVAIDKIADRYPSIIDAGPAATPVCFDDPIGDYVCPGTGEYDPLAGVDAILDGY
jgi:hypothetical protein